MTILDYHDRTKHSAASIRSNRHHLDWDNHPLPFKIYRGLEPIPLPREITGVEVPALAAVASDGASPSTRWAPDRWTLARLLYLSAGITRRKSYPGGQEMQFRAAACTGALYHIDLYLVNGALPDLDPGVHHFAVHDFSLRRLRAGDHRAVLADATAGEAAVASAPAVLVLTSTFWRNAWKYQSRAYRHSFWDSGTILANLFAVASAMGAPARLVTAFVDRQVNDLLGLDTVREVAIAIVALGHRPDERPPSAPKIVRLDLPTEPLSASEIDYPAIRGAHQASSLDSSERVMAFRSAASVSSVPPFEKGGSGGISSASIPLRPLAGPPAITLHRTIVRRGSARRFARAPISFEQLSTMLAAVSGKVPTDFLPPDAGVAERLNDVYLIVNAVDGLDSGKYVLGRAGKAIEPLGKGDFRRDAGFLDLGQELAADASVNFYMLADLRAVVERYGERGYRAASLEAAILGGKLYLAAYALGLGATGLTFFDDDVTAFFSPHAGGKGVMFLVAVGRQSKG